MRQDEPSDFISIREVHELAFGQSPEAGSALVQAGLNGLQSLNRAFVIGLGDPLYYARFGFKPAYRYKFTKECKGENRAVILTHLLNHQ
ncbi:MAG: hypothetical protein K0U86_17490 [Planctomycetes bacterium]|nr:hypothetical protein [Planctomycetota bacterium]MCH9726699.1 hypothetical protein [Planctomycetota bacterium]MCH9779607.1 hypothetical protein [Planctomycetota bacterium]MCH9791977.1 hypothetical protein [Planctomycetota bacterium]